MSKKALIVGCGYVGSRLRELLLENQWSVTAVRKTKTSEEGTLSLDVTRPFVLNESFTHVFYLLSASEFSEEAYQNAYVQGVQETLKALEDLGSQARFLFVSSTSVFQENSGGEVTEVSEVRNEDFASRALLEGERLVRDSQFESTVVRFSGIYGPGRDRLIRRLRSGEALLQDPSFISNRIHREDCARILFHLAERQNLEELYIGTDSFPTVYNEVLAWASHELGVKTPEQFSSPAQGRFMSSKKCLNTRLLHTGYSFQYPSFKEGLKTLF